MPTMAVQNRLVDIDPASVALYQQQNISFDSACVNSGAQLTYTPAGLNRIKVVLAGQGVIDLANSALVFKYDPVVTGSTAPDLVADNIAKLGIYGFDIASLFEIEQFQINTTSLLTGSSRSDLFNQMMRIFSGRDQKKNNWTAGQDSVEVGFSPAELAGTGGYLLSVPSLARKAYQKVQGQRLMNAYRHYALSGVKATLLKNTQAENRSIGNQYSVRLGDLFPQISSMGPIANRFPLAFVSQISFTLRLQDPLQNHVYAGVAFDDTTTQNHNKNFISYALSDVQVCRIESQFNGPQAKASVEALLQEGRLSSTYTDFEHAVFDVTNSSQMTFALPVSLRDLRFVAMAFTLKGQKLVEMKTGTYSSGEINMLDTSKSHPWNCGLTLFPVKIKDVYYQINGQSRFPISQPQQRELSDIWPNFQKLCVRQLIGDSENLDLNYFDYISGQNAVVVLPFHREMFAGQSINLADQSNTMQITIAFQNPNVDAGGVAISGYQPQGVNVTDLECHIFRVFDKQLQIQKLSAMVF